MLLQPTLFTDLGYYTRPIWDKNPNKFEIIPHYYSEDVPLKDLCKLHGWELKDETEITKSKVYDAIIFSVELDLLEIRIRELWDVVDTFVILESNATFTGETKSYTFEQHKKQFAFAASKIHHTMIQQTELPTGESPFYNEIGMRRAMNQALSDAGVKQGDLVVMSDVDELIRGKSLLLLKSCRGIPDRMHLQLKNYIYSFEFPLDMQSWRAHIVRFDTTETFYSHGQISDYLLADAGWHCSFCFRTIKEFQFKMKSYSHSDRIRHEGILAPNRIQQTICDGKDIFDMPPESYTYKDMVSKLGAIEPIASAVGLPASVLRNAERYYFLLPGGCIREDYEQIV
ncbi:Beta-1,4-mannosyl-glycoprotein 4-beta-N-acetylglucosaminyltransferase [Choanephora cucurbitarum]|uniref:Beta-1,4-mannosyl-glycoprotein 4-beta-N-acetylglucosaminyltransferase n=1 Tax=Choanephora cucurbitarum TaxID=101091 RepID=A0A1C7N336_9FUNG|nr:Beta-1,4-mannosyl-glycoprotein 4-beta-N-acetylglucosaminyltransferase [Choanephora cucurbitarum]